MEVTVMDERVADMVAQLEDGATLQEVASDYNITGERVRQITEGLVDSNKQRAARQAASFSMIDQYKDDIVAEWLSGKDTSDIARDFGLVHEHLLIRLREWKSEVNDLAWRRRQVVVATRDHTGLSDEECIDIIRFIADREGHAPSITDYEIWREQFPAWPSVPSILRGGRKWSDLIRRAGFTPNEKPKGMGMATYSNEDIFAALRHVRDIVGHLPSMGEYERYQLEDTIKASTIRHRFLSWIKAVEAFVEHEEAQKT